MSKNYTWNLTSLFSSDSDPAMVKDREETNRVVLAFVNKWKNRDDYLSEPIILRKALDEYEQLISRYDTCGKVGVYLLLRQRQEQGNTEIQAKINKDHEEEVRLINELEFFTIRLSKVDQSQQKRFLKSPDLKPYKHWLEILFTNSKYVLSEEEEKIINLMAKTSMTNWVKMLSKFISKEEREVLTESGKKEKKSFEELVTLSSKSIDENVRKDSTNAINQILEKHSDVAESEINSLLESKKVQDDLRGYERPDQARHISCDMKSETVDTIVESVSANFGISHDFYKFIAKLHSVQKIEYSDRSLPYFGTVENNYSYEDALEIVRKSYKQLDSQFEDIIDSFVENERIDVYPRKGKSGGAFCASFQKELPVYILLNYTDKLDDVTTLAHELGHGVNAILLQKQNALNFGTPLSTAEVASTFFEDFALEEQLKEADDEMKFSIMVTKLNDEVATIQRQIGCYLFEQDLHMGFREKGYLSKEEIGRLFTENMSKYLGDSVITDGYENWWIYWSHIRRPFYVFTYASGLLISKSLQASVNEDPSFIEKVKTFLSAGKSASPKDIFAEMDIDITDSEFWNKGMNTTRELLAETEALAKKLGKI